MNTQGGSPLSDTDLAARGMGIAVQARLRPDAQAVASPGGRRTWSELNARANQLARSLREAGLKVGDAVALLCHNCPEFVETWAACMRAGLRLTPVNWHQSADVVSYIVENCDARALIASSRFVDAAMKAAASPGLLLRLAIGGEIPGFQTYDAVLAAQPLDDIPDPEIGSSMLYTSGTTGRPKGVFRSTRPTVSQLTDRVLETAAFNPAAGDIALVTGPLYHAAPLALNLVTPMNAGVGCVLMDKWDAEETLRLIEAHRVTHTHLVPTMIHRMLQLPEATRARYDLSSLRWLLHGAAPCPAHLKQAAMDWLGPVIYEYYSSTEGGGVFIDPHEWLSKPGSVGRPVNGVAIRLLDPDGNEVPAGETGTIYIAAPVTGRFEYYKDPTKTHSSYRGDWFTLGDLGYLDADGYLFLTGRSAELIISGGVNIYPVEIDDVLIRHPDVADAAVVGAPNEDWGEEIKAVVELKAGVAPDETVRASILEFAREQLPGFQRPRSIDFVEALPRNAAGKVMRQQVRAPYWEGRTKTI